MRTILADLRKINEIVQYDNVWRDSETADLPFNKLTEILGSLLKVDLYIEMCIRDRSWSVCHRSEREKWKSYNRKLSFK